MDELEINSSFKKGKLPFKCPNIGLAIPYPLDIIVKNIGQTIKLKCRDCDHTQIQNSVKV